MAASIADVIVTQCPATIDAVKLVGCVRDLIAYHNESTGYQRIKEAGQEPQNQQALQVSSLGSSDDHEAVELAKDFMSVFVSLMDRHLASEHKRFAALDVARKSTILTVEEVLSATHDGVSLESRLVHLPANYIIASYVCTMGAVHTVKELEFQIPALQSIIGEQHGFMTADLRSWHYFLHAPLAYHAENYLTAVEGPHVLDVAHRVTAVWNFSRRKWPLLVDSHNLCESSWWRHIANKMVLKYDEATVLHTVAAASRTATTLIVTHVPQHVPLNHVRYLGQTKTAPTTHDHFKLMLVVENTPNDSTTCAASAVPAWAVSTPFTAVNAGDVQVSHLRSHAFSAVAACVDTTNDTLFRSLSGSVVQTEVQLEDSLETMRAAQTTNVYEDMKRHIATLAEKKDVLVKNRHELLATRSHFAAVADIASKLQRLYDALERSSIPPAQLNDIAQGNATSFLHAFVVPRLQDHLRHGPSRSEEQILTMDEAHPFIKWIIAYGTTEDERTENRVNEEENLSAKNSRVSMCFHLVRQFVHTFAVDGNTQAIVAAARYMYSADVELLSALAAGNGGDHLAADEAFNLEMVDHMLLIHLLSGSQPSSTLPTQLAPKHAPKDFVDEVTMTSRFQRLSTLLSSSQMLIRMVGDADASPSSLQDYLEWAEHTQRILGRVEAMRCDVEEFMVHWMWLCSRLSGSNVTLVDTSSVVAMEREIWQQWDNFNVALNELGQRKANCAALATSWIRDLATELCKDADNALSQLVGLGGLSNPNALVEHASSVEVLLQRRQKLQKDADLVGVLVAPVGSLLVLQQWVLPAKN